MTHSNDVEELDEIFNNCGVIGDDGKYYPKPDKLKAKLSQLIRSKQVEELKKVDVAYEQGYYNIIHKKEMVRLAPKHYLEQRIEFLRKDK